MSKYRYKIFTDGGCSLDKEMGSTAYIILDTEDDKKPVIVSEGVSYIPECKSSGEAEMKAINEALLYLDNNICPREGENVSITTDSKYAIECLTKWYQVWWLRGWLTKSGTEVKNKEEIQKILKIQRKYAIDYRWCRSRSEEYNIHVDDMASNELKRVLEDHAELTESVLDEI